MPPSSDAAAQPLSTPAAAVLVPVAHGSESLETFAIVNVLRRAGLAVTLASAEGWLTIDGTRGLKFVADVALADVLGQPWSMVVIPGGEPGARALGANAGLIALLRSRLAAAQPVAAICAAPALVLGANGLLVGRRATGYPAFRDGVPGWIDAPVVTDGALITSQGPGTAIAFALAIAERLAGPAVAQDVARTMLAA